MTVLILGTVLHKKTVLYPLLNTVAQYRIGLSNITVL